jgi:hypothetical protein
MDIGTISSSSYLPPQFAENRAVRAVAREASSTQENAVTTNRDRKEVGNQNPVLPSNPGAVNATQTSPASENRVTDTTRAEREKQQAEETRRTQRQEVPVASGGSIKLDVEDGDRVLKVFDSKDVLIYQLPPKGALMLIKAQENAQQSQVQTSA